MPVTGPIFKKDVSGVGDLLLFQSRRPGSPPRTEASSHDPMFGNVVMPPRISQSFENDFTNRILWVGGDWRRVLHSFEMDAKLAPWSRNGSIATRIIAIAVLLQELSLLASLTSTRQYSALSNLLCSLPKIVLVNDLGRPRHTHSILGGRFDLMLILSQDGGPKDHTGDVHHIDNLETLQDVPPIRSGAFEEIEIRSNIGASHSNSDLHN
ncbi:hypothetical protein B0H11DRAFT_1934874 [Mycena galericulata]|nr:hypothetical protein B0H11DRAFT_1934874 [Mycena galericulata]